MPQTLTLDDLAQYGAPSPPPTTARPIAPRTAQPAPAAPLGQKTLTLDDLAQYGTPPPKPAAPQVDNPDQHGFWRSFYDEGIAPIADMVVGTIKRGDLGEKAASDMLDAFKSQLTNFAAHPDIRNLPVIGTGATATAARMQRQYDAGNYSGMIGSALGFVGQFAAPEAAASAFEKLPAVAQAAARAADATGQWADAAGAAAKAAAPDVARGAAKTAASAAIGHLLPAPEFWRIAASLGAGEKIGGGLGQIGRGLKAGAEAYSGTRAAQAAADAAEAAKAATAGRVPLWQQAYDAAAEAKAADSPAADAARAAEDARPPTEALWEDARRANAEAPANADAAAAVAAPAQAPAGGAPVPDWQQAFDAAPDARESLTPEDWQNIEHLRAQRRLEDAIDQHAVYLHMQAQDLEWSNRARQADRYAGYLIKNNLDATPENLQQAAEALEPPDISKRTGLPLGKARPPGDDTTDMIAERVDWYRAKQAAAQPAQIAQPAAAQVPIGERPAAEVGAMNAEEAGAAPTTLEQQLADSIEAVKSKRGQQQAAEVPGHVESEVPLPRSAPRNEVDTGGTGGRPPVAAPDSPGAGARGEQTAVDVPGEQRAYPATYTVRELSDVQPSHLGATFQPNPKYEYANDRLYDDPRNQRKIVDWSTKQAFNPRNLLNTAPTSEIGPPVVDAAGNVLGGNGRSMILQRVYNASEGGASYRAELDRTAHHYGIDPASYAHMKQPVLVRELDPRVLQNEGDAARAITDFNKIGTAALTPSERAIADAKGVSQKTLDDIAARMDRLGPDSTLAQAVEGRQGIDVLRNLERDGVISPQEGAQLATETKLTRAGKDRVSGLMLGRFFTDAKQMDALSDSMRNKLERMAAPLARAEATTGYSLSPTIKGALDLLEDAEAHGAATLDDHIQQQGLFGDREYSPEAIAFAKALKSTNPVELTHAARRYAERAKYAREYQGPGMFGDIPAPLAPTAAFHDSFEHLAK